jgi:hypothetical protein
MVLIVSTRQVLHFEGVYPPALLGIYIFLVQHIHLFRALQPGGAINSIGAESGGAPASDMIGNTIITAVRLKIAVGDQMP